MIVTEPIFPCLQRLIVQGCQQLRKIQLHLPTLKSLEAVGNSRLHTFSLTAPLLKHLDLTGHQLKQGAFDLQTHSPDVTVQGTCLHENDVVQALQNPKETRLELESKGLNDLDISFLVHHPLFNKHRLHYEAINLAGKKIGDLGAAAVAKALQGSKVYTVNLNGNNIGDRFRGRNVC